MKVRRRARNEIIVTLDDIEATQIIENTWWLMTKDGDDSDLDFTDMSDEEFISKLTTCLNGFV